MARGIMVWVLLMGLVGLVSLEVCRWRIGIPLVIVWVLLIGLGGLLWALVLNIFDDNRYADDKRQESASPDYYDGEKSYDRSFWQSKTDLRELVVRRAS